jgi:hypothetical protein
VSFHVFVRRVHLYLGMFLLPWVFMYGLSSVPFNHSPWFQSRYGPEQWIARIDRPYHHPIPPEAEWKAFGGRILQDLGLKGDYGVYRANDKQFNVYLFNFWSATRITYFIDQQRILAEDRKFRWDHFLTALHARGGFEQESIRHTAWGVTVDIVCVGIVLWIATGIYMWWLIPQCRWWGIAAIGGGAAAFLAFLLAL